MLMLVVLLGRLGTLMTLAGALPLNRRPHSISKFLLAVDMSPPKKNNLRSGSLLFYPEHPREVSRSDMKARENSPTVVDGPQGTEQLFEEIQADWETMLEPWIPHGITGHIDLVTSSYLNLSLVDRLPPNTQTNTNHNSPFRYDPGTALISTPTRSLRGNGKLYRVAEMGYSQAPHPEPGRVNSTVPYAYRLYAKSLGRGTKFWMLKSPDLDFLAGEGEKGNYTSGVGIASGPELGPSDGMEYPVTLRAPFINREHRGVYAYCATYDPNPQGSTMSLSVAPCGRTSCVSEPLGMNGTSAFAMHTLQHWTSDFHSYDYGPVPSSNSNTGSSGQLAQTISRNPDGTVAPGVFNIQSCDHLDPSCHAAQVFLYDSTTGIIRPIYNPGGMEGHDGTHIQPPGEVELQPVPLWRGVIMKFEVEDRRPLQGTGLNRTTEVQDLAFDRKTQPQPEFQELIE